MADVEHLLRSDRRIAATVEQWDADPRLLNTPEGTVDLHTGKLRASRREDYATRITAIVPAIRADCPRWIKFLDRAMAGDQELIDFLQRIAGYAFTGSTAEHALFLLHGTGRNGKGTLVNTWRRILAGYATTAATEIFMASNTTSILRAWPTCAAPAWWPRARLKKEMLGRVTHEVSHRRRPD